MSSQVLQQALDALENSQKYIQAASDGKRLLGWGMQLDLNDISIHALRQALSAPNTQQQADLFWNDDDPETGYRSIDELLDSVWSDGVLEVGAEFTVQQAVSLPRIKVRVTEIDDESGLEYEVVQPAIVPA